MRMGAVRWDLPATEDEVPVDLHTNQYNEARLTVGNRTRRLTAQELRSLASAADILAAVIDPEEES